MTDKISNGRVNTIIRGDCIAGLGRLPAGSVDLAFADPPFNIGYDYDVYHDKLEEDRYLAWSRDWIGAVYRALKPDGTFWLAIGDEYAAQLKLESQKIGFACRSWVVWYYTFGVNCKYKFTRSHAHLFYFVKDAEKFTFRGEKFDNRVRSARQLVYNDNRANPKGRLPDDTWIIRPAGTAGGLTADEGAWTQEDAEDTWSLRPQDLAECFTPKEDTWYFPRVAGTFKERAGFHGCQMPEQLLGRVISVCSNEGDLVLDPFSGSATTLAVAKKLGRRYLGFEISQDYVERGKERLAAVNIGDRLDGSAEPLMTAPRTHTRHSATAKSGKQKSSAKTKRVSDKSRDNLSVERRYGERLLELTMLGVVEAFRQTHAGFSADRVVADPDRNEDFVAACKQIGLSGDGRIWNRLLFRLRKAGKLVHIKTTERTDISWTDCDQYIFASEIALQSLIDDDRAESLDEILCDPMLAAEFDARASSYAPGCSPLEYRWAALKLRKQAKFARTSAQVLRRLKPRFEKFTPIESLNFDEVPDSPGVYIVSEDSDKSLYVGESLRLRERLKKQFKQPQLDQWTAMSRSLGIRTSATETAATQMLAWQCCLVNKLRPKLNYHELASAS